MKKALLASLLVLAGCSQQASDGYTFEEAEWVRNDHNVEIVLYNSEYELKKVFPKFTGKEVVEGRELFAFSVIDGAKCQIHLVDFRNSYKPESLGHEMAHCVYGRFHKVGIK